MQHNDFYDVYVERIMKKANEYNFIIFKIYTSLK